MKRKEKSGHEKRCESKRKDLRTTAAAPFQKSIVDMFNARATSIPKPKPPTCRPDSSSEQQDMQGKIDTDVQTSDISNQGHKQVFQANINGSKGDLESLDIVNKELTTQASSAPQLSQQPSTSSSGTQETSVSTAESQSPLCY